MKQEKRRFAARCFFFITHYFVNRFCYSKLILSLFFLLPSLSVRAAQTGFPPTHLQGIRPLGMGEAFTAVADDQNALYYNPAGLARLEGWSFEIINAFFGLNENTTVSAVNGLVDKFQKAGSSTAAQLQVFKDQLGKNFGMRVGFNPYFVMPRFGLGIYGDAEINGTIHNPKDDFVNIDVRNDVDVRVGYAHKFMADKVFVGAAAYFRNRTLVLGDMGLDQLGALVNKSNKSTNDRLKDFIQGGSGVGVDVGMLIVPTEVWQPAFGLAIINLGDTRFVNSDPLGLGGKKPQNIPQTVNAGMSVAPVHDTGAFGKMVTRFAFDLRGVNLPTPASKKWAAGAEFGWNRLATVQVGTSEGYLSAGFELRLYVLNIRYATYKSERGFYANQAPERKHLVGLKLLL